MCFVNNNNRVLRLGLHQNKLMMKLQQMIVRSDSGLGWAFRSSFDLDTVSNVAICVYRPNT